MSELQSIAGIKKVGVVTARFNSPVTSRLQAGALKHLEEIGLKSNQVVSVDVPGAYEIPLAVKGLLEAGCDGVAAIGAVVRGDTTHYDYVCNAVERGCSELQLQYMKPVAFGVITTENGEQAYDRAGGKKGNKGAEAAEVMIEMINLMKKIN